MQTTIANPVSLKPLQQKVKVGKTKEEEALDKAKLSQVVQRLKASAAQKEARQAADRAAKDAVSKLADAMKSDLAVTTDAAVQKTAQTSNAADSKGISGPRGTGIEPDFYMKQYLSAVYQKIHDHWILPDLDVVDSSCQRNCLGFTPQPRANFIINRKDHLVIPVRDWISHIVCQITLAVDGLGHLCMGMRVN